MHIVSNPRSRVVQKPVNANPGLNVITEALCFVV